MERENLYLHEHDDEDTSVDLPEWLEQGIDPVLRDSDDDVPQASSMPVVQAISSQGISSQHMVTSAGVTPIVLTPTGGSTPKDTKEWRDLDKFYASESESEDEGEEGEDEEEGEEDEEGEEEGEASGNDGDSGEDGENSDDEEGVKYDSDPSHDRTQ
jgi:AP-3 complex subunit beta